MTELCDIAWKYKTDKCPQIKHHYTEFYYDMFKDRRMTVRKVIEIGLCGDPYYVVGASLYMWKEWFPNAKIFGADIDAELMFSDERIETFLCDQSSDNDLKNLIQHTGTDIDLFIDDGSHIPAHQVLTCQTVMPLLDKDIVYVIEDVGNLDILNHLTDYDCQVLRVSHRRYNDDRMVVVRNKHEQS